MPHCDDLEKERFLFLSGDDLDIVHTVSAVGGLVETRPAVEAESFTRVTVLSVVSTGSAVEAESLTGVKEEPAASGFLSSQLSAVCVRLIMVNASKNSGQ